MKLFDTTIDGMRVYVGEDEHTQFRYSIAVVNGEYRYHGVANNLVNVGLALTEAGERLNELKESYRPDQRRDEGSRVQDHGHRGALQRIHKAET